MNLDSIYDLIAATNITLKKTPIHHPHVKSLQKAMNNVTYQDDIKEIIKGFLEKMDAKS